MSGEAFAGLAALLADEKEAAVPEVGDPEGPRPVHRSRKGAPDPDVARDPATVGLEVGMPCLHNLPPPPGETDNHMNTRDIWGGKISKTPYLSNIESKTSDIFASHSGQVMCFADL